MRLETARNISLSLITTSNARMTDRSTELLHIPPIKLHAWFKSFLTGCTQSVKINSKIHSNLYSLSSFITSGVIQRSVLGPFFCAVYTNDIVKCFSLWLPILYADDLKVIVPIDLFDFSKSFSVIMNDLNALSA